MVEVVGTDFMRLAFELTRRPPPPSRPSSAGQTPPAPPSAGEIVDNVAKRSGLSKEELALAKSLIDDGQDHLFAHWDRGEGKKIKSQMKQLLALHKSYPLENGLLSYTANARKLLLASKEGKNPLEGWTPKVSESG